MARVSLDRIGGELNLLLEEREVVQAFRLLRQWGLLPGIHAELNARRPFLERLAEACSARFRFVRLGDAEVWTRRCLACNMVIILSKYHLRKRQNLDLFVSESFLSTVRRSARLFYAAARRPSEQECED